MLVLSLFVVVSWMIGDVGIGGGIGCGRGGVGGECWWVAVGGGGDGVGGGVCIGGCVCVGVDGGGGGGGGGDGGWLGEWWRWWWWSWSWWYLVSASLRQRIDPHLSMLR